MNKKILRYISIVLFVFLASLCYHANTYAMDDEAFFKQLLVNWVPYCYDKAFIGEITQTDYKNFDSLIDEKYRGNYANPTDLYLPTIDTDMNKITQKGDDDGRAINCYALFAGDKTGSGLDGKMDGLFNIYNIKIPEKKWSGGSSSDDEISNFLTKLGYTITTENTTEQASNVEYCYNAYVDVTTAETIDLGRFCVNSDNYPLNANTTYTFNGGDTSRFVPTAHYQSAPPPARISYEQAKNNPSLTNYFKITISQVDSSGKYTYCTTGMTNRTTAQAAICSGVVSLSPYNPEVGTFDAVTNNWASAPRMYVKVSKKTVNSSSSTSKKNIFKRGSGNETKKKIIKTITGEEFNGATRFTDADKYDLYVSYLSKYYGISASSSIGSESQCQEDKPSKLVDSSKNEYYIWNKSRGWCLAALSTSKVEDEKIMTVFQPSSNLLLDKVIKTLPELVELMGQLNYDDVDSFGDIDSMGNLPDDDADPVEQTCANSGAAESLGWIVCPILQFLSNATSTMYEKYIEPALQVEPTLFDESLSPTFEAWQVFQGIANGLFIVLLLIVIFSQLTGIGINNYGVKKIMPKFIIAAILINLSYIICVLLVDLSNIIGNSIQALFSNISVQVPENMTVDVNGFDVPLRDTSAGTGIGMTAITGVALLAILATAIFATVQSGGLGAILLALLVAAISIFSAIFFLFMLLAAREAAIVVLTVLSPIAVVCFMLPNTQKIFDKWVKLGSGLLLVYPICGLLVGGGDFVSRLLLVTNQNEANFFTAFIAMIVGIIPVFFIPTVLRGSLKAAGDIGARISSVGRDASKRFGKNTSNAISGSERYKAAQENARMRRTRFRAGLDKDGNTRNDIGKFGRFMRGGDKSMARNRAQYIQDISAKNREERLMKDNVGFDAALEAQKKGVEAQEVADYMTLINNRTRNGADEDTLMDVFEKYAASGNKSGMLAVAKIAGRRKDTASRFIAKAMMNPKKQYDSNLMRSLAKEMTEGESAGNYRSASPLAFEYASNINKGKDNADNSMIYEDSAGNEAIVSYDSWANTQENVDKAMNHHVTDSKELVGVQNSNLNQIADMIANGQMGSEESTRLQNLARDTINNKGTTGIWDSTKSDAIYKIAGMTPGVASEGQEFDVRAMDDNTLLDIATNPNVSMDNKTRTAAEAEYNRRMNNNK